eukprot:UN26737
MKKGFLLNSGSKNRTKKDNLVFNEVRDNLNKSLGTLADDATFVKNITDDKEKMKTMMTPKFQIALKLFQTSPQEALKKYGKDKEVMEILRWATGQIGNELIRRGKMIKTKTTL